MALTIHLTFWSTLKDDAKFISSDELLEPAGRQHSEVLYAELPETIERSRAPWNEEDYAWEFLVKVNKVSVSVLLGDHPDREGEWLLIVNPVVLFPFFRRANVRLAVETVAASIESFLQSDPRFRSVRRRSKDDL